MKHRTNLVAIALASITFCSVGLGAVNEEAYSEWYKKGIEAVKLGQLKNAEVCFSAALQYKPGDFNASKGLEMTRERLNTESPVVPDSPASPAPYKISTSAQASDSWVAPSEQSFIRVSLGSSPGIDEFSFDSGHSGNIAADGGVQLEVLQVKRSWSESNPNLGWMSGWGLFYSNHAGEDAVGDTVEIDAFGVMGELGVAYKASDSFVLELLPYFGWGIAGNELSGYERGTGGLYMYGVKGGAFYHLDDNVELGLEIGSGYVKQEQEYERSDGSTFEGTFKGSGGRIAFVVAVKF